MKHKIIFILAAILLFSACQKQPTYRTEQGKVFGTYYRIIYNSQQNLKDVFQDAFKAINASLSTFDSLSIISRVNRGDTLVEVDSLFKSVFWLSKDISKQTGGAFDITVAPLVNAWGFGYNPQQNCSKEKVDSLMLLVGMDKVILDSDNKIQKQNPKLLLDCSAVAKGFACDLVANQLKAHGVEDFLIDIGGEMALSGKNSRGDDWHIGISKAIESSDSISADVQRVAALSHCGVATSGNYRQFYITKERKVGHIIDPRTGYPTQGNVLSASVVAPNAAIADAFATAFMVISDTTEIMQIAANSPYNLAVFLIYKAEDGSHQEVYNSRFAIYLNAQ